MTASLTLSCPACARPNGKARTSCLYCGKPLPKPEPGGQDSEGQADPQKATSAAPADPAQLDALVRQALSGQKVGVAQLTSALQGTRSSPPAYDPVSSPAHVLQAKTPPEGERPQSYRISSAGPPQPTVKVSVPASLPLPPDPRSMRVRVEEPSFAERTGPHRAEGGESVQLFPSFRQGYGLVIDAPGDASLAAELGAALHLDLATARLHAAARGPRLVLRHPQREALETRAAQVRERLGLTARTVSREMLLQMPPALCLVSAEDWRLRVTSEPLWRMEADAPLREPPTRVVEVKRVQLILPGVVFVRRFREQAVSRRLTRFGEEGLRGGSLQERTVLELLIQTEAQQQLPIRLVEGIADVRGLPGHVDGSTLRSVKAWQGQLELHWPGARNMPRFSARVPDGPVTRVGDGEDVVLSGWPAWEEYSALCRLLLG